MANQALLYAAADLLKDLPVRIVVLWQIDSRSLANNICVGVQECHCMLFLTEDNSFRGEDTSITLDEVKEATKVQFPGGSSRSSSSLGMV